MADELPSLPEVSATVSDADVSSALNNLYPGLSSPAAEPAPSPATVADYIKQPIGEAVRGFTSGFSGVAKAAATAGTALGQLSVSADRGDTTPAYPLKPETKIGDAIDFVGQKFSPAPVAALKDSMLASKLPATFGSIASFMVGGGGAKILAGGSIKAIALAAGEDAAAEAASGGAEMSAAARAAAEDAARKSATQLVHHVAAGVLGAAAQGVAGYQDAVAGGATPDAAAKAFLVNLPIGATYGIPVAELMKPGSTLLSKMAKDLGVGVGVMDAQQILSNLSARGLYSPDRSPLEGLGETTTVGGIATAALSAMSHTILGPQKTAEINKASETVDQNSPPGAAGMAPAAPAASQNVVENPAQAYLLPQEVKDKLTAVAQKEASQGADKLLPEDWQAIQNATVKDNGHPDYHKDADQFYQQQVAIAKAAGEPASAVELAKSEPVKYGWQPDGTFLQDPELVAKLEAAKAGKEVETKPPEEAAKPSDQQPSPPEAATAPAAPKEKPVTPVETKLPPLNPGDRPVTIQKPDGTTYEATANEKAYNFGGKEVLSIGRVVNGKWSHGVLADGEKIVADPQREAAMKAAQTVNAADLAAKETAPTKPVWQKLQGDPDKLKDVVDTSTAPAVEKTDASEGKQGKKIAQLYREIAPGSDPKAPGTMEAMFKTSRAKGDSRLESQKRVVMLSPDGSHVTVSTPGEVQRSVSGKRTWVKSIASYGKNGEVVNRAYDDLLTEGWKPMASIKTDVSAKSEVATYSLHQWQNDIRPSILETVKGRLHEAESGVPVMGEAKGPAEVGAGSEQPTGDAPAAAAEFGELHKSATPAGKLFADGTRAKLKAKDEQVKLDRPSVVKLVKQLGDPKWKSEDEAHEQIVDAINALPQDVSMRLLDAISPKDKFSQEVDYMEGYERLKERILKIYGDKKLDAETAADKIAGVSERGTETKPAGEDAAGRGKNPASERATSAAKAAATDADAASAGLTLTREHAGSIHDALDGAEVESADDVLPAMMGEGLDDEMKAMAHDLGMDNPNATRTEKAKALSDLSEIIYDTYSSAGKNRQKFSQRLVEAVLDEHDEQAAGKGAGLLQPETAGDLTGERAVAGDQSAAAGRAGAKPVEAGRAGDTGKPAGDAAAGVAAAGRPAESARAGAEGELTVWRAGDAKGTHRGGVQYFALTKDVADKFAEGGEFGRPGAKSVQTTLPADAKIFDWSKATPEEKKILGAEKFIEPDGHPSFDWFERDKGVQDRLRQMGYDGIKISEGKAGQSIAMLPDKTVRNRELDSGDTLNGHEKYVPESLPREAERALGKGSLRAAADVARSVHLAIGEAGAEHPTRGRERASLNKELKPKEQEALREYAKANGLMLDHDAFNKEWMANGSIAGAEHRVIPNNDGSGLVTKSNDVSMHGTYLDLIHRIGLHNSLFPETRMEFKGFQEGPQGLELVFKQKAIEALRGATRDEVKVEMAKRGFDHLDKDRDDYYNPRTGVIVEDLHDENALHTKNGLIIIDPIPTMAKPEHYNQGVDLETNLREAQEQQLRGRLARYAPPQERNYAAEDKATIAESRVTPAKAAEVFRRVSYALRSIGVAVHELSNAVSGMAKDCAKYEEWKNAKGEISRAISLSMADTHAPTVDNLISLLHEAGHAVFARETPERQAALHEAISKATDEVLGLHNFTEKVSGRYLTETERAGIVQEGRLVESVAQGLVERGIDPTEAKSIVQRIGLALRSLYQRAVMAMQQAMGLPMNAETALQYFETRMKLALTGGKADSVVSFLGGPRMTMPDFAHVDGMNVVRNRDIRGTSDPLEAAVSKDLTNPTEEKEPGVAGQNIVHNVLTAAVKAFNEEGHNPGGIAPDEIIKRMGLPDYYAGGELPATKIQAANEALVKAGFKPVDPNLNIRDIQNEAVKKQAAATGLRSLQEIRDKWRSDRRDAEATIKSAKRELERLAEPLNRAVKDYTDLDMIASQAKLRMQDVITEQREAEKAVPELTGKQSMLDQVLRQLDTEIKGNALDARYREALNRLAKRMGGGEDVPFADMLQKVADLQLDWKNAKASELRDQIRMIDDPALESMKGNDHDGRALMATAISFAKKNDFLMNLLTLRRSSAMEERAQVNKTLQAALSSSSSAELEAGRLAARLTSLKGLTSKLLANIKDMKARQHELIDEQARQRHFVNFHNLADPIVTHAMRPLEAHIGALNVDVNIGPETKNVPVPQSADQRPESFTRKTFNLTNKDGEVTMQSEVRADLKKMADWLDANRENRAALGADFNEVEAFHEKLSNHLVYFGLADPIKQLWIAKWLAPTAEKLRMVNTPLTRSAAYMVENANALYRKFRNDEQKHSKEWEVRRAGAMKALGFTNMDSFKLNVTDTFKDYVSKNKDIRSAFASNKDAVEASIKAGMEHLRQDPHTAELLKSPAAAKAVEDFFRKTVEVNAWMAANGKSMGNKVLDPKLGLYRDVIGSEAYEFARGVSDRAEQMFLGMKDWAAGMDAKKISEMHSAGDGEGLTATLAPRFTKPVWDGFVKWISYKEGASAFSGPLRADGTYDYASRDNVIKAYENAQGNPVTFAQDLFMLEHGHESGANISDFVGETMHTLDSQYKLLAAMRGDSSEMNGRGMPTPQRHIMDARLTDAAPREFYDYIDSDRSRLGNLIKSQAYHAAFGRRMENYYQTIDAAKAQQADLVQKYDALAAEIKDAPKKGLLDQIFTGRALRRAVLEKAKTEVDANGKPYDVKALAEAHDNFRAVQKADKEIQGYLDQNRSRPPELNVLAQIMSGVGSLTVAGPGTAFIAHTIAFEQAIRKFGLNADGLGMMKDTATSTAAVALRGFLHSFGRQAANDADHIAALERNGLSNPNTIMKWSDQVRSIMVSPDYVHNVLAKGAIYAARGAQLVSSRLSAFHYLARVIQLGNSVAWSKKISSVVERGMEHFADHPENFADPEFKFTAKQLGVSEGRAFDYLQFALGKYGLDLREMVEDSMRRRVGGKDAPILTDKIYQRIAQVSLDDMTMESSPTTRAGFFVNNSLGQLSNPMLGWTLQKTYDVVRSMREANGQRSLNGYKSAMMAYAAILPLAMVAAYTRNKFDEEIQGKKQNVADLSTITGPEDAFKTALENAARVGTFGIAGEAMNMAVNTDNSRPLTLDGRLFFLNTLENTVSSINNLCHQRNLDYATVVRPMLSSLGGNGFYQYAGIINHTFSLDNDEARNSNRISVNNFLRVAGRQNEMDVRTYMGTMQTSSAPTPWRASIGNMVMAAYANNPKDFMDARKEAVARLVDSGMKAPEAEKKVIQMYEDANPLRVVFKSLPSQQEYQKMLASMDDNGKVATATALRLYQHYGSQIGLTASTFGRGAAATAARTSGTGTSGITDPTIASMLQKFRPQATSLDDLRRRASVGL